MFTWLSQLAEEEEEGEAASSEEAFVCIHSRGSKGSSRPIKEEGRFVESRERLLNLVSSFDK